MSQPWLEEAQDVFLLEHMQAVASRRQVHHPGAETPLADIEASRSAAAPGVQACPKSNEHSKTHNTYTTAKNRAVKPYAHIQEGARHRVQVLHLQS